MRLEYPVLVDELLSKLASLKEFYTEHTPIFTSAINGVEDSMGRVAIGQTRLARLARISVASSAASVLGPIIESGDMNHTLTRSVDRLMTLIREISGEFDVEQEPFQDIPTPRGWKHEKNSFKKTTFDGDIFTITKRSNLPGGQWTVFYFGAPVAVAENIGCATRYADAFISLRNRAKGNLAVQAARGPRRTPPGPSFK
ncbi:hypothetical protein [Rhizobium sp. MHM7A]|uniref:hypothetical protein n=1 Tax=Rhizobium sp. MHM7A TaxID=2583233 RepID=UPI0011059A55|nr:hypothetical protein [Rhizobium sp. MHM7A]TLX16894.1 hypothetical protein FFR93_05985 [Rhizobium sp. MHM7A]